MLPDFLIVGPPRCGTKSLSYYLNQHPEICVSHYKSEIHYFDMNFDKKLKWYEKHFEDCKKENLIGEKTATYIEKEKYAKRIFKVLPNVKLIFIFREPVSRCYSDYWQAVKIGKEDRSFKEIINENNKYIRRSKYYTLLKNFDFIPEKQKYIMISENFWSDTISSIKGLFEFLDVDKTFTPKKEKQIKKGKAPRSKFLAKLAYNRYNLPLINGNRELEITLRDTINAINLKNDYPKMDKEIKKELKKRFMSEIKKLERHLDKDLSIWYD
ncbi:MAG: sulfotransferase family protein [Candidatus Woesearchaeota archaeon]